MQQRPKDIACPTCGAPAEEGQLVCLECGARVALSYRRPPSWKLPVAIVAVLGVLVLAGAVVAYEAIDDEARQEVSATPPAPKAKTAGSEAPEAAPSGGKETAKPKPAEKGAAAAKGAAGKRAAERKAAARKPPAAASGGLVKRGKLYAWPKTLEAFTVVLLSGEDRESATAFASEVADRNDAKAGVIRSDDFSSLPEGFFIVFGGVYETRERADQAVERLSGRYPGSFAQLVKR